ncbi:MAG: DUF29 domain-containing protein [Cyanobacteria bacterium M5B4]|nr:MAG: DUF29 domain-containing protein [Cyanobacteria bacterium M5B4]
MTDTQSLYEKDYALWLDRTIADLKAKRLEAIDWQNLIEEVENLAKSERRELTNRLTTLLEHGLKVKFSDFVQDYRGWIETIRRSQREIKRLLNSSPSLKPYWYEIFDDCYKEALIFLRESNDYCRFIFPDQCPFPTDPDRLLNDTFWD